MLRALGDVEVYTTAIKAMVRVSPCVWWRVRPRSASSIAKYAMVTLLRRAQRPRWA